VELSLSGTNAESLPDDIVHSLPKLQTLHLDHCENLSCLPVSLGALKALVYVSVIGCTALVHPPKSQQADPRKTARFLRELHENSAIWRRLKVALLLVIH
jgi:hypothetical protein